jgi:hypothetical protein
LYPKLQAKSGFDLLIYSRNCFRLEVDFDVEGSEKTILSFKTQSSLCRNRNIKAGQMLYSVRQSRIVKGQETDNAGKYPI